MIYFYALSTQIAYSYTLLVFGVKLFILCALVIVPNSYVIGTILFRVVDALNLNASFYTLVAHYTILCVLVNDIMQNYK